MLLTTRGLALLLGAAPILVAGTYLPSALFVAAAYIVVALGLVLADAALSPRREDFALTRQCDSRLSLAAENPIRLNLTNKSRLPLRFAVRDEFPDGFLTDHWQVAGTLPPKDAVALTYHLKPLRRGDYRFGDLHLRHRGPLGLIVRQERFPAAAAVKVYPNLLAVRRYDLLSRRGQRYDAGLRATRLPGQGSEFERLREYQSDDDYRRISWKATARRGRPISVAYEAERSQNVLVMLDTGRMMASPIGPLAKLDYAVNAAMLLAYVAARSGDNVGLLAFADRVTLHLPPRRGQRQFLAMLEALYRVQAQLTEPDYDAVFRHLAIHNRKRSLVVLFTDLIDAETCRLMVSHIAALSPHHLTVCATLADPGIAGLAAATPSDSPSLYRRAVAADLLAERRVAIQELRRYGAIAIDCPADQLTPAVIDKYLELKSRTRL